MVSQIIAFLNSLRAPVKAGLASVFNKQVGWFIYLNTIVVAIIVISMGAFAFYYAGQGLWTLIVFAALMLA